MTSICDCSLFATSLKERLSPVARRLYLSISQVEPRHLKVVTERLAGRASYHLWRKWTPYRPSVLFFLKKKLVDSVWYQVAIFNFGLQATNPTYNEVKTQSLYLNQLNRSNSTSHPVMSSVTFSIKKLSVDTPILPPTPTPAQNYNPTFLTLQHGHWNLLSPNDALNLEK